MIQFSKKVGFRQVFGRKVVGFEYSFFKIGVLYLQWTKRTGKQKHPSRRVHFLLQKNTGNDERQIKPVEIKGMSEVIRRTSIPEVDEGCRQQAPDVSSGKYDLFSL